MSHVRGLSLHEIRALRRQCANATPDHPPYPAACAKCRLGVGWLPHEGPQEEFLASQVREILYGGQSGGGKTAALVAMPLRWADHPKFQALILRRDTTQLGKLLKEAAEIYPKVVRGARPRYTGNACVWRFPSGAQVRFDHCQLESDIARYDGDEFQICGFDELTHFSKAMFVGINARCRSPAPGLPRYARATSNPGGDGHEWVFERWRPWLDPKCAEAVGLPERRDRSGELLPPAAPSTVLWFDPETDKIVSVDTPHAISRTFIPAKLEDNPSLDLNAPEYRASLMALDAVRRAQLLRGDWLAKPARGAYFKRAWFKMVTTRPTADVVARVRCWDLAATEQGPGKKQGKNPDWTVGELWSKTRDGRLWLENVRRFRGTPLEVERAIESAAEADGRAVRIRLPQDPGQAGKAQAANFVRTLAGYNVRAKQVTGDKVTRAGPFSAQVEGGNVHVVEGAWNTAFFEELEAFPEGGHDDQVDAGADAIEELATDSPWSGDLDKYQGFRPRDISGDGRQSWQRGEFDRPASHSSDTDRLKRSGRW
jgi:predicted phage terminase large subunit-like protein